MNKAERTRQQLFDEIQELTARLSEAQETLRAILSGEVDGLVVKTTEGERVFTLSGADHPYRVMVETMNEGAVTLTSEGTILFCNQRFADIVQAPLEKVIGSSIHSYIASPDILLFETLMERGLKENSRGELALRTGAENPVAVLISVSPLQTTDVPGVLCALMVDINERKKMEEALRKSHNDLELQDVELRKALSDIITLKEQLEVENIYFRHTNKMKNKCNYSAPCSLTFINSGHRP